MAFYYIKKKDWFLICYNGIFTKENYTTLGVILVKKHKQ